MRSYHIYDTEIGRICLMEEDGALTNLFFPEPTDEFRKEAAERRAGKLLVPETAVCRETPLLKKAYGQLQEYFAGKRRSFELPLALHGTEFQLAVWQALQEIPYGKTCSYQDIAVRCGNAKACRAVGMANNRNPIAIIVPCHRVVGRSGKLVGYGGGLSVKEKLLALEKAACCGKGQGQGEGKGKGETGGQILC